MLLLYSGSLTYFKYDVAVGVVMMQEWVVVTYLIGYKKELLNMGPVNLAIKYVGKIIYIYI